MWTSVQRARYETQVGYAHGSIWRARKVADEAGDEGLCEDLEQFLKELLRLTEDSLKGRKIRGQQSLLPE